MNQELKVFADGLREVMNKVKLSGLRPFVCDGSPLAREVFLVGTNPATPMDQNFWCFWNDDRGFDKIAFMEAYKETRRHLSPTRQTIEWVIQFSAPMKCLETNIYATPKPSGERLSKEERNTAPFDYLLERINPKLVIAHGKPATEYLKANPPECELKCVSHFSSKSWFDIVLIETLRTLRARESALNES